MKYVTSGSRDLRYLARRGMRLRYVGYVGYGNLGDEVIYDAIRAMLPARANLYDHEQMGRLVRGMAPLLNFRGTILGGGTLVQPAEMFLHAAEQALATVDAPLAVFGTGIADADLWQEFGKVVRTERWCNVLRRSAILGVRGPLSAQHLRDWGYDGEIEIVGDPAIWFARPQFAAKRHEKRVGINLGPSEGFVRGQDEAAIVDYGAALIRNLTRSGWKITLLPMRSHDIDYMMQAVRQSGCSGIPVHQDYMSVATTMDMLESCDVFIGEKLHSVVLACCVGTPAIMLAYRTKCQDFMLSIGREAWSTSTDALDSDQTMDQVSALYQDLEGHQRQLCASLTAKRADLIDFAGRVGDILIGAHHVG